jgi:hypothetical protein
VTYTPNPGFSGADIFTYTITDPQGLTDTATVLVTVIDPTPGFFGTEGDDVFYVRRDAAGTKIEVFANRTGAGTPIFTAPFDTAPALTFDTKGGTDFLYVDASNGSPVPADSFLTYHSGTGANHLTVLNGSVRIDSTVAAGGSLDTKVDPGAELITHLFRQNSLAVAEGAKATVLENSTGAVASVLTSLWFGVGSKVDITNNALVVDYTGDSPASAIRDKILSGRGGSGLGASWNGTGIISSTVAEVNSTDPESRSVGYAENASLPLGAYTHFRGVAVDNTAVLVAYARTADANLDGVVNDDDVTIVGASYAPGAANPSWAMGDFEYNGFVDDDDVTLLGAFYNPIANLIAKTIPNPIANTIAGAPTRPPVDTLEGISPLSKVRMDAELIELLARSITDHSKAWSASLAIESRYRSFAGGTTPSDTRDQMLRKAIDHDARDHIFLR